MQHPGRVQHGQHHDAYICKDAPPHVCDAQRRQDQAQRLDRQRKDNVLIGNAHALAGDAHRKADLCRVIVHQHNVGGLDGGIAAQRAHRNADVSAHQHRCIVDAVTHKGQLFFLRLLAQQLLDPLDLIGGQQARMNLVNAQILGHQLGHGGGVTGQHDGAHALRLKALHGGPGSGLLLVRDQDRAQKAAVTRHINDRTRALGGGVGDFFAFHQAGIAGQHGMTVHQRFHAVACDLLRIGGAAGVQPRAGLAQALADGMA